MALTYKKIATVSDALSEELRKLAAEHPASGKLRILMRNAIAEAFIQMVRGSSVEHFKEAARHRRASRLDAALFNAGAAVALKDDPKLQKRYSGYVTALLQR